MRPRVLRWLVIGFVLERMGLVVIAALREPPSGGSSGFFEFCATCVCENVSVLHPLTLTGANRLLVHFVMEARVLSTKTSKN